MLEVKNKRTEPTLGDKRLDAQLDPFILIVVTLASLLIFFHFHMDSVFSERSQVKKCHTWSLMASDTLDEEINDVEYYEFLFRTCMREAGYTL